MATEAHDTATQALPTPGAGPRLLHTPVHSIAPSLTNPRKTFDQAKLQELADSIKASGVHQPVLLRPLPAHRLEDTHREARANKRPAPEFELIAGERRWRASQLAGLAEIPAMVRPMTDTEALEAQVIENLQREDVTELEEAEGYEVLMRTGNLNADQVGAKIGKSRSYVYARLKVLDLCHKAREALRGAFVAGAEWQEGREQLEMAAGAVHVATASPPPSNTLWRLLTNGYDFEFVNQLGDAHPEKSVLIDRATKNWQQICAEVASLRTTTAMSDAARDLLAERARQVQEEGWTPEHDDEHSNGEMAEAAACYAGTAHAPLSLKRRQCSGHWPWAAKWWKPSDARRDLIKAGALILAEIERMDRNGKTEPQDKAA